jgi:predicted Zn-ribbon and HTH transcriptional regulator
MNTKQCPFCGHALTEEELKQLKCTYCKSNFIVTETGEIKYKK